LQIRSRIHKERIQQKPGRVRLQILDQNLLEAEAEAEAEEQSADFEAESTRNGRFGRAKYCRFGSRIHRKRIQQKPGRAKLQIVEQNLLEAEAEAESEDQSADFEAESTRNCRFGNRIHRKRIQQKPGRAKLQIVGSRI
jgi:hypothetical protein